MRAWLASLLGKRFWVLAYALIGLALALPQGPKWMGRSIGPLLGGVLFLTCLKIPLTRVKHELRGRAAPLRVLVLCAVKLVALPLLTYGLLRSLMPKWAFGVAMVTGMPAGMSSAAFTDVYKGRTELALLVILATSLLSPLSVPLVVALLQPGKGLQPSALLPQAAYIGVLLAAPFCLAQLARRFWGRWIDKRQATFGPLALSLLAALIFIATNGTRAQWLSPSLGDMAKALAGVTVACLLAWASARLLAPWLGRERAIAFGCNSIYVNNGLGVAFALRFFGGSGHAVLPTILITLPIVWVITLVSRMGNANAPALETPSPSADPRQG